MLLYYGDGVFLEMLEASFIVLRLHNVLFIKLMIILADFIGNLIVILIPILIFTPVVRVYEP